MKKYLNSVEEVLKALKEGKKIFDRDNCNMFMQIKDGFICSFCENISYVSINTTFYITNNNSQRYYTEEPEPLKFEVNRAYKTRNGDKVFLDSKSQIDGKNILLFVGMKQSAYYFATDIKGKYINAIEHPHDIINYWEEEK